MIELGNYIGDSRTSQAHDTRKGRPVIDTSRSLLSKALEDGDRTTRLLRLFLLVGLASLYR